MRIALFVLAVLLSQSRERPAIYRTLNDRYLPPVAASRDEWERRAAALREHVLASAGLLPLPERTPLRAVVFDELAASDYTVSKVYFESLPGFFVTGNLYRPAGTGPFPAVLSPHGHWAYGRLVDTPVASGPGRAINLARQGFVVFAYDMVGYNDSRQLTHGFGGRREKLWGLSLAGLQLWNSIRALDFLESLPDVRRDAIGATGESGGGTQTFLLAAADPRVAVAVPVNMISLQSRFRGSAAPETCRRPPNWPRAAWSSMGRARDSWQRARVSRERCSPLKRSSRSSAGLADDRHREDRSASLQTLAAGEERIPIIAVMGAASLAMLGRMLRQPLDLRAILLRRLCPGLRHDAVLPPPAPAVKPATIACVPP